MQNGKENVAYDLSLFDDSLKVNKEVELRTECSLPHIIKKCKKSKQQLKKEEKGINAKVRNVVCVSVLIFILFGSLVVGRARLTELNDHLSHLEKELAISQSENVRMNMELNAQISLENAGEYASEVLGMTKQEKYQIKYLDLSRDNKLVLSENQKKKTGLQKIQEKIDDFLAYIF